MSRPRRFGWRDVRVDTYRIVTCAERVIEYTAAYSFDEFVANGLCYDVMPRNLEIMGEATKRLPEGVLARFPDVQWRDLAGFLDRPAHSYDALDDRIVCARWRRRRSNLQQIPADDHRATESAPRRVDPHLIRDGRIIRRNEVREHQRFHASGFGHTPRVLR